MIEIREASHDDVEHIRELFRLEYGTHYYYPQFYDLHELHRYIYGDGSLMLVAIDTDTNIVAGTASVIFSVAAYNDLVGEFGRLVVHPEFRRRGIGKLLMQERLARVKQRLHVGIVENRATHTFSQRISNKFGFVPVGFSPMKMLETRRESTAGYVQYFGDALSLRRNNPHLIPEIGPLAAMVLENCQLPNDPILDDVAAPLPYDDDFEISQLRTEGFSSLLRIQRGRVKHREVFGPVRLHYGLFQIQARHSHYLIAKRQGMVSGGLGFMLDENEKAARIFELISANDEPVRLMLTELIRLCETQYGVEYLEIDVSAYAPRIQRTLLELGFLPVSYIPANVFHEVERLDVVKMAKLFVPLELGDVEVCDAIRPLAELVVSRFRSNAVLPQIESASQQAPLFVGLTAEQRKQVTASAALATFSAGEQIYQAGDSALCWYLLLDGHVVLTDHHRRVAEISGGQCLGETSLLSVTSRSHSLTATAKSEVNAAVFEHDSFLQLIRRNPDIGLTIFRNLAADVSTKLSRDAFRIERLIAACLPPTKKLRTS